MGIFSKTKQLKIIEAVGLPGSGKTTTMEYVLKDFRDKGYRVIPNRSLEVDNSKKGGLDTYINVAFRFIINFHKVVYISFMTIRAGFFKYSYKLIRIYLINKVNTYKTADYILYDQNIINFLTTACAREQISFSDARRILKMFDFGLYTIILYINTPPKFALNRSVIRDKKHPIRDMTETDAMAFMERYNFYLNKFLTIISETDNSEIITVDGEDIPGNNASSFIKKITN